MRTVLPYSNDTTSLATASNPAVLKKSVTDRRTIAEFIANQGARGATDQEIAAGCPSVHSDAVRARRGECWAYGMITKECGEKRATESGNMAQVYHVTAKGLHALGRPETDWCVRWPA